jgi:hypothetical protein
MKVRQRHGVLSSETSEEASVALDDLSEATKKERQELIFLGEVSDTLEISEESAHLLQRSGETEVVQPSHTSAVAALLCSGGRFSALRRQSEQWQCFHESLKDWEEVWQEREDEGWPKDFVWGSRGVMERFGDLFLVMLQDEREGLLSPLLNQYKGEARDVYDCESCAREEQCLCRAQFLTPNRSITGDRTREGEGVRFQEANEGSWLEMERGA